MKSFLPIILLLLLFVNSTSLSQSDFTEIKTFIDSNITRNFLYTNFDNNRNTAAMLSEFNFFKKLGKVDIFLKNYYTSSITKLNENLYRDFDNVRAGAGYDFTEEVNVSANYFAQFYADDKTFQFKGSSTNMAYLSGVYDGLINGSQLYSAINAGYRVESQFEELDRGASLSGELGVYSMNVSDFIVDGQLRLGYESLDPRKKNLVYTHLLMERSFDNNLARNEFDGVYSRIRKDFYFPADLNSQMQFGVNNNIEKRIESIYRFFDRFDYSISDNMSVVFTVTPNYRRVTKENTYIPFTPTLEPSIYDTDIQELSVAGDIALNFQFSKVDYQLKAYYRERDEKHFLLNPQRLSANFVDQVESSEATKNNHSNIFVMSSNLFYNPNLMNRFELTGSASILKYDTQSEENFDERDEAGYLIYAAHRFNNLKNLVLLTSVDLNLYHTVYILSQKSSNNNWNRVLRFTSRSFFEPYDWLRNTGTFSVLANYTVYDFQDIISSIKSYSFRQMNLKDSLILKFGGHFGADIYAEMKLYERGELNWSGFSQRPVSYFEDKIINSELNFFFNKFITFSAGFKYFEQKRYKYVEGERVFDSFVKTTGPFAGVKAEWKNRSYLELVGGYDNYSYGESAPATKNGIFYVNAGVNF